MHRRTRFTGPWTRYSAASGRLNCSSRNSDSSVGQVLTTSSRIASPKWRVVRPDRKAWRRLVMSTSSMSRSESRVTRNCENASTVRPGNDEPRCARITLDRSTKPCSPRSAQRIGQADHARQYARHLDDRDSIRAAEGVTPAQARDEVQGLVGDHRERVGRIQTHRHQQRTTPGFRRNAPPSAVVPRCAGRG